MNQACDNGTPSLTAFNSLNNVLAVNLLVVSLSSLQYHCGTVLGDLLSQRSTASPFSLNADVGYSMSTSRAACC